ncbi:hypothetical protein amrb99_14340 [Actinomadura sp. RB99]|nr:hypothetical protein [Actinomadura sp. RB99]
MDVDLSTDLNGFLPLVTRLLSGHSELAIGSRLARGAHTARGPKWEIISGCYNLLLRAVMRARFSDARCGFKAARTEVVKALLPVVEDEEWFLRHRVAAARRTSRPAGANAFHVRDAGPPPSGGESCIQQVTSFPSSSMSSHLTVGS